MKDLLIRTFTGISLVVLVVAAILAGPLPFLGLNLLLLVLGMKELFILVPAKNSRNPHLVMALASVLLIPAVYLVMQVHLTPYLLLVPLVGWLIGLAWAGKLIPGMLIMWWLAVPLGSFFLLGYVTEPGTYLPLLPLTIIILVWINDTFAYLVGSSFGRHPMTPRISPGKTWEGTAGGVLFTLVAGYVIHRVTGTWMSGGWIILSLLISLLSLTGDLFESSLKRRHQVKDTGGVLPGHGGILDRFDSLLFAAPVLLLLFTLMKNWP